MKRVACCCLVLSLANPRALAEEPSYPLFLSCWSDAVVPSFVARPRHQDDEAPRSLRFYSEGPEQCWRETVAPEGTQFISAYGGSPNKRYSDFVQDASGDILTLGLRGTSLVVCKFARDSESWQIAHELPGEHRVGRESSFYGSFSCSIHRQLPTRRELADAVPKEMPLRVFCYNAHQPRCCGNPLRPVFQSDDEGSTWMQYEEPLSQVELTPSLGRGMSDFTAANHKAIRAFGKSNRGRLPAISLTASLVSPDGTILAMCWQTAPKKYDANGFELEGREFWLIASEDGGKTWKPRSRGALVVYTIPQLGSPHTSPTLMNRALFIAMDGPQGLIVFFCPYPLTYDTSWYVWRETTMQWHNFPNTTTPGLPDSRPFHLFSPQAWTTPGGRF